MQLEKKTATHKIFKRNDGRYAVETLKGQPVNGEEKIAVLQAEGLVTKPEPKAAPEPEVEEAPAAETEEASVAEEAPAAEAPAVDKEPSTDKKSEKKKD